MIVDATTRPRISIVIPTFQRRNLVLATVRSVAAQEYRHPFEVIVVVDGSSDGSAQALRDLDLSVPVSVLEQPNQGASCARNGGAAAARGDIILFLDDDMEAHPKLLAAHDRSHREGADAVIGHLPLHPDAPKNLLSDGVRQWTDRRLIRLVGATDPQLTLHDLLTGQMSVRREVFDALGGFSAAFTRRGSFGNEDVDFGYRLLRAGYRVVFNPAAITWQNYVVEPRQFLRQWRQTGQADVTFARRHPEHRHTLFRMNGARRRLNRLVLRPLAAVPSVARPASAAVRALALALFPSWNGCGRFWRAIVARLFHGARQLEYWIGVQEAGGIPATHPVRVLCYHAVEDWADEPAMSDYGVPPLQFEEQIAALERSGYHFISGDEFLGFIQGHGGLPSKPVLLTFDDGLASVTSALPVLRRHGISAIVFVVSGRIGDTNRWDQHLFQTNRRTLDVRQLSDLGRSGIVEIGCHSQSHANLTEASESELEQEIGGSIAALEQVGIRPRMFAYPYGEQDVRVRAVMARAGVAAAFTVTSGCVTAGDDPLRLRRIEIRRSDSGWLFLKKVHAAGVERTQLHRRAVRRARQVLRRCVAEVHGALSMLPTLKALRNRR